MSKLLIVFYCCLILNSCESITNNTESNKKNNKVKTDTTFYLNRKIKAIVDKNNKGFKVVYSEEGVLIDSMILIDGMIEGERFEFFNTGELNFVTNYLNDKIFEGTVFNKNGELVSYSSFDYAEELMFFVDYLKDSIKKVDGFTIPSFVIEKQYEKGSDIELAFIIAKPPLFKSNLTVYWFNKKVLKKMSADKFNRTKFSFKHDSIQGNEFVFVNELIFENLNFVLKDSLFIEINDNGISNFERN